MTSSLFDVCGIGNAIVDIAATCDDTFLESESIPKGGMQLIEQDRAKSLCQRITPKLQASGGSAANTMAGLVSFGGKAAYMGKVANDTLGDVFTRDMRAIDVHFETTPTNGSAPTALCLTLVTPDAQRSMCTYLGASVEFSESDINPSLIENSKITYLEGYLFDRPSAKAAFQKAADISHAAHKKMALTLSDSFCVGRHRSAFRDLVKNKIDIVFSNAEELTSLYEAQSLDEAVSIARTECALVVSTRGSDGVIIATPDAVLECAALPDVQLVDTTGAGDAFAAGFLFGLAREKNLETCGHYGNIAAAEVISHFGPRPINRLANLI